MILFFNLNAQDIERSFFAFLVENHYVLKIYFLTALLVKNVKEKNSKYQNLYLDWICI